MASNNMDYIIIKDESPVLFVISKEVIIYGDKKEAEEDALICGGVVVPINDDHYGIK